ncbi:MAG: acyl-CoA dehydrogenase, partial [Chloroflexota bacterium]|nr:acyl-CoA dehydrogenase [Chloroflexota bacterium]
AQKMTIDYVKQRATFGATLATRQAIQWMLVDSHIEINATRLMALETAWKADQGMDIRHEASVIKLVATEMAYRVLDRAIQCHGGIGLTKDLPLERWLREVRVMRIVEGPSEVHKFVIARNLLRD